LRRTVTTAGVNSNIAANISAKA
jgi:hypothetical protein